MVWFPQEIVTNIAAFLPAPQRPDDNGHHQRGASNRPRIATVSRMWQRAIEPLIFRSLRITSEDLAAFISLFSPASNPRRSLLKELRFDIVLPDYDDAACAQYETNEDRNRNSAAASSCMSTFLDELSKWPSHYRLNLTLDIYAPTDSSHRTAAKRSEDLHAVEIGERRDLFGDRYRYSYIRLWNTHYRPVSCVAALSPPQGDRFLEPSSLVALVSAFPRVETVSWSHRDPGFFRVLRRQHMQQFAEALTVYPVSSTARTFSLTIKTPGYPHFVRPPHLAGRVSGGSMCDALRRLIGRSSLHKFRYQGPIDPSLFWPDGSETTDSEWSSLREVWIRFDMASLSGEWFFKPYESVPHDPALYDLPLTQSFLVLPPPGYGSKEDTAAGLKMVKDLETPTDFEGVPLPGIYFRQISRDEVIVPLLEAIARRLSHTPSLRTLYLEAALPGRWGLWFFSYAAPGELSGYEEWMEEPDPDLLRARIFLHTTIWRPDPKVVNMLRDIGEKCYGQESIVTFLPFLS